MKFLITQLNKSYLKKIKNLCVLFIVFVFLVGCSSNDSQISTVEENSYNVEEKSNYESSEEEEDLNQDENEDTNDLDYDSEEEYETSSSHDYQDDDSYDHDTDDYDEGDHIGEKVYIANGNSYYHKISNCKYLEGAKTEKVTLTSDMRKYECNCFTNPVEYKKESNQHSEKHHSSKKNSSGKTVYIAKGNSYYHKSASCKFIKGADVSKVDISDVGGKHPCNCIKY